MFDSTNIRRQFPILDQEGLVYLDSAASSQKPLCVIDGVKRFLHNDYSNIHRGAHFLGDRATERYEQARQKTADFLGAKSAREIVFTKNATEAINLIARSLGDWEGFFEPGDRIVITRMEHHANHVPWLQLAQRKGLKLDFVDFDEEKNLVTDNLDRLLAAPAKLFAMPHVSNVLGTVNPVQDLCRRAREMGVSTLVDGCQAVQHFPVNVSEIGCDFYVFSGHKAYAPSGNGTLYGRLELLKQMPPFLGGGEMIREVTYEGFIPAEVPHKFEAGTPPISQVIGLGYALDFLNDLGMENVREHDRRLTLLARELLAQIPEVRILSHQNATGLITFSVHGMQNYDMSDYLSDHGICVRVGHHCAEPLHGILGEKTSLRASFGVHTTEEEVGRFAETVKKGIVELK